MLYTSATVKECNGAITGAVGEWTARLGVLDGQSGEFLVRGAGASAAEASPPAVSGFCEFLEAGEIYVGTPTMASMAQHVLAAGSPRLLTKAATKVGFCPGPYDLLCRHALLVDYMWVGLMMYRTIAATVAWHSWVDSAAGGTHGA